MADFALGFQSPTDFAVAVIFLPIRLTALSAFAIFARFFASTCPQR
jgi:hypothetical protein